MELSSCVEVIVRTVREPLLVLDNKNRRVIDCTPSFISTFRIAEQEVKGKSVTEFPGEAWDSLMNSLDEVLRKNMEVRDFPFSSIDTRGATYLINASQLESEGLELLLLSFRALSEAVMKAEDIQYMKRYKEIFAHAPAMACLQEPGHVVVYANQRYLQLMRQKSAIGKSVQELIPQAEQQELLQVLDEVYRTRKANVAKEVPIELKDDQGNVELKYLDYVYQPLPDLEGEVKRVFIHVSDVTDQVLHRKSVEQRENDLQRLVDAVPAMLWMADSEGNGIYLNRNWYNYTGQEMHETEVHGWASALHPEDRQKALSAFLAANEAHEDFSSSFRLYNEHEGTYRMALNQARPRYSPQGEYEGMIGIVVDVHQEKMKERLLQEQEHRLRTIIQEAPVATGVFIGAELKVEFANDAMLALIGKDSEILGKTFSEALPALRTSAFYHILKQVLKTGKTQRSENEPTEVPSGGGPGKAYFDFFYMPLRKANGDIYGVLHTAIDVTETVVSKNQLKKSEAYFRQIADFIPDKVARADADGEFVYFNRHWLRYTGLSRERLREEGWTSTIHPEEKEEFEQRWKRSLETGGKFEMELRCHDSEGEYHWHLSRAEAVKNGKGDILMWIATNTDIEKIKEEEKRKGDFLKMVSHELKTPVTSMKGYVQLLLNVISTKEDPEVGTLPLRPSLERVNYQISRLTRLISEMLDLSRIEEDKLELQKSSFNLNELVNETVQDIGYTNTQHKIKVVHQCNCEVYADRDRIGQVLINLITNGIKYSPESNELQVAISEDGEDRVRLRVQDSGIGIAAKDQERIFERFYRIGGEDRDTYSGFGIGLFVAQEIIRRHNSSIRVSSRKGEGSEFYFTLAAGKKKQ